MSRWEDKMRRVNARLVHRFNHDVILHHDDIDDVCVLGIFSNPFNLNKEDGGGHVANSAPELYLLDLDAEGLQLRGTLTVASQKWVIISPPEPDGTGLTKLILSKYDGKQQSVTDIRY